MDYETPKQIKTVYYRPFRTAIMARSLPKQTNKQIIYKTKDETKSIVGRPRNKWTVQLILHCIGIGIALKINFFLG